MEAGILKKGPLQSNCVVMRRGWFYTLSREIACAVPSGLPETIDEAIEAERLIEYLKGIKDDEITVVVEDKTLTIKGSNREKSRMALMEEVLLPIDSVERANTYLPITQQFSEAVDLAQKCTLKRAEFLKACIHIHPKYVEGSDNTRLLRYPIKNFVRQSVLVRGESIKAITQLGMTKAAETESWLHFRNPMGLRVSVRKWEMKKYPDFGPILAMRGRPIVFPKNITEAADIAALFAEETEGIRLTTRKNQIHIQSGDVSGEYERIIDAQYSGPEISFRIPPKLLIELIDKGTNCELTDCSLRMEGDRFIYVAGLETEGT